MFCARSRPTNKGNGEQKPITKKLQSFIKPNKKKVLVSCPDPSKKGGERVVLFFIFVLFFFISLWMVSHPFIGHIMDTKVLRPFS